MPLDDYPMTSPDDQFVSEYEKQQKANQEPEYTGFGPGDYDVGGVGSEPKYTANDTIIDPGQSTGGGGQPDNDIIIDPGQSTGGGGQPGDDTTVNIGPVEIANPAAKPGDPGWGWKYYSDGTAISPEGKYYYQGEEVYDPANPSGSGIMGFLNKAFGADTAKKLKSLFIDDKGNVNLGMMGAIAGGIYGLTGGNKPETGGYKGTIPKLTAVRQQVEQPAYTPYSGQATMGRRYFSDVQYAPLTDAAAIEAAKTETLKQAGILANYKPNIVEPQVAANKASSNDDVMSKVKLANPNLDWSKYSPNKMTMDYDEFDQARDSYLKNISGSLVNTNPNQDRVMAEKSVLPVATTTMAKGGITSLKEARYLRGQTDGMADKIPSSIDDKQPAKLSHGEFVIPADVVSHLGNGNSDAGANVLYKMMDRVRKARTGTKKQGKRIEPEKFTPGGIAAYAKGGTVAFQTGGTTSVTSGTSSIGPTAGTTEQSLAPWVGDYVTSYLGRAQALAQTPYQAYQGPLSAGVSPLQQQAFQKASTLGGTFDSSAATQYMNPYLQQTLAPQMQAMQRQADIQRGVLGAQATKFGAFGGARSGILGSQLNADLMRQQQQATGQAYQSAYDKAMQQYNLSRQQQISDINTMAGLGGLQRGIEQEGITAGMKAFEQEREDPFQKLKFEQSMLTGLPLSTTTTTPNLTPLQQLGLTGDQVTKLYDMLKNWMNPTAAPAPRQIG